MCWFKSNSPKSIASFLVPHYKNIAQTCVCAMFLYGNTGVDERQATESSKIEGFHRRLESPRISLSTVRRAQKEIPVEYTKNSR